jgi:hypothetical protein
MVVVQHMVVVLHIKAERLINAAKAIVRRIAFNFNWPGAVTIVACAPE